MEPINVLIVEPDPARRGRLAAWLSGEADCTVVGAGGGIVDACQANSPASPVDVLLINVDQPEMTRMEAWAAIHALLPGVQVVALLEDAEDPILLAALGAGAIGLHRADAEPSVVWRTVRRAAQGVADYDPWLAERAKRVLMQSVDRTQAPVRGLNVDQHKAENPRTHWGTPVRLTWREKEVLTLVSHGMSNREVADRLYLSEKTVRNCVSEILDKLGVSNRTQAALWAVEHGSVSRG